MLPLAASLLSALLPWLSVARSCVDAGSVWLGCDSFDKLMLERDLPPSAVWLCPGPPWPESIQKLPSIDTTYPPQPAEQVCMDTPITYNHTIPNSGAFRPVGAESGEFLYCPPQRWLNNLQHGVPVFLYHPCAPIRQRVRLSALARSCLPDYVLTPHPDLNPQSPFALVSWGRTLELSSLAVLEEVCGWLELTASHGHRGDVGGRGKYTLLLTHPANRHQPRYWTDKRPAGRSQALQRESLRRCCEESLSLIQDGSVEGDAGLGRGRRRGKRETPKMEVERDRRRGGRRRRRVDLRMPAEKERDTLRPKRQEVREPQISHRRGTDRGQVTLSLSKDNDTREKEHRGKVRMTDSVGQDTAEDKRGNAKLGNQQEIEVQKRHKMDLKSQTRELPKSEHEHKQQAVTHTEPSTEATAPLEGAAAVLSNRMRTPRTEEAVWAAAALGFLLVLLALSVLHTRLYRYWHTTPSLYWHDPDQEYDSVADIIRRRLKRTGRRKRRASQSRRQDCVLLPSSSSTDEDEARL